MAFNEFNKYDLVIQHQQNEMAKALYLSSLNQNCVNNFASNQNIISNENELNLEDLASLVYEKLMLKKKSEKSDLSFREKVQPSRSEISFSKQENDLKFLDDLIHDETNQSNKIKESNKSLTSTKLDPKYFTNTSEQEMEETKLIEDLFFI